MSANTLFLRLEGPVQSWGLNESKFAIRRSGDCPSKSGVLGMLCATLGLSRQKARERLVELAQLRMGVRLDRPGVHSWDYHTVGARMKMRTAEGKTKPGALLTRREYLNDASFLVVLQGAPYLIAELHHAVQNPVWPPYLGRKTCPPSRPLLEQSPADYPDLPSALDSVPWRPRTNGETIPETLECFLEWQPSTETPEAPQETLVFHDVPVSFDPPAHHPRFVLQQKVKLGKNGEVFFDETPLQKPPALPNRKRADYTNSAYKKAREKRLEMDHYLCVFCKSPGNTVQHITYQRAGGEESVEDLRTLCRLCHDAATMLEYGLDMGMERINPEEPLWRERISEKRQEIIEYRSRTNRNRLLKGKKEGKA